MKLNRGCGCLAIVLAAINVLILISVFIGMAQGTTSLPISLGMVAIFIANSAACVLLGLPSLREGRMHTPTEGEDVPEGEGEDVPEGEGEDEG